jgi:hypothetical protein
MKVDIIKYSPNTDSRQQSLLGHCLVEINGRLKIWMKVLRGSRGAFIKLPSVRIGEEFLPALIHEDENFEREISNHVLPILVEKQLIGDS